MEDNTIQKGLESPEWKVLRKDPALLPFGSFTFPSWGVWEGYGVRLVTGKANEVDSWTLSASAMMIIERTTVRQVAGKCNLNDLNYTLGQLVFTVKLALPPHFSIYPPTPHSEMSIIF